MVQEKGIIDNNQITIGQSISYIKQRRDGVTVLTKHMHALTLWRGDIVHLTKKYLIKVNIKNTLGVIIG